MRDAIKRALARAAEWIRVRLGLVDPLDELPPVQEMPTEILGKHVIWTLPTSTRHVWMTVLLLADSKGRVHAGAEQIAAHSDVSLDECRGALLELEAGGQIARHLDHGWVICSHERYQRQQAQA